MPRSMADAGPLLGPYDVLLFDMDGTLLTSRPAIERVWNAWSMRWGLNPADVTHYLHGRRATDALDHFLPQLDPRQRAHEIEWVESRELKDTDGVVEIPGAREFLKSLPKERWAVVTSAARRLALARISAAGLPRPQLMIAAEDVTLGKPDPTGYRMAAQQLGFDARHALIFEDAPAGLAAALNSGADVIAVIEGSERPSMSVTHEICDFRGLRATWTGSGIFCSA